MRAPKWTRRRAPEPVAAEEGAAGPEELMAKLDALGELDEAERRRVACALIGHSRAVSLHYGYVHCARCGCQVGDMTHGGYGFEDGVVMGHNCATCRENWERMGWEDKLFVPDPFGKGEK